MEWFFFHAASLGLTALLGGMVAFAILFAPLVFTQLPADIAGGFIRKVFPFYYLYVLVLGLLTGLFMALSNHGFLGFVVAVVGLVCAYTRWFLMPEINRLRDADLAGDEAA